MHEIASTQAFWDNIYDASAYSRDLSADIRRAVARAHSFFGPLEGRTLLDLGCGAGATSIFWAGTGASVTSVDSSEIAIHALRQRCRQLGLTNVAPIVCDATAIERLGRFDFIFGSMILHHLEPFRSVARSLRQSLDDGGRAFFYENNGASDLLIWFRTNVVGRLWVPKAGDADEFPLTPGEIETLRELFKVTVEYPEMVFFQLASTYLLRRRLKKPMKAIDDFLYRRRIGVRWSYRQYVMLEAAG